MRLVEHWWNGNWGHLFRRDIWLRTDGTVWRVEVRRGEAEVFRDYDAEDDARAQVAELLRERGPWQRLRD